MIAPRRLCALPLPAWLLPTAAQGQQLGGGAGPAVSLPQVLAALMLCLAAAFAAALLLRRRGLSAGWPGLRGLTSALAASSRIAVIETRRISAHADLCLLRCGGVEYLILCGPAQAQVLSQSPAEAT